MLEKKNKKKKGANNERKRHCDLIFAKPGVDHCGQGTANKLPEACKHGTEPTPRLLAKTCQGLCRSPDPFHEA